MNGAVTQLEKSPSRPLTEVRVFHRWSNTIGRDDLGSAAVSRGWRTHGQHWPEPEAKLVMLLILCIDCSCEKTELIHLGLKICAHKSAEPGDAHQSTCSTFHFCPIEELLAVQTSSIGYPVRLKHANARERLACFNHLYSHTQLLRDMPLTTHHSQLRSWHLSHLRARLLIHPNHPIALALSKEYDFNSQVIPVPPAIRTRQC